MGKFNISLKNSSQEPAIEILQYLFLLYSIIAICRYRFVLTKIQGYMQGFQYFSSVNFISEDPTLPPSNLP
jgi:hypothetical protein